MFGIARARTEAGPDEALLFNAELTAPQSGARRCARSRARKSAENKVQPGMVASALTHSGAQWTARPTLTLRLSVSALKRSRARKGAENKIQADRLGQCERLRRAVDCAHYRLSAFLL